LRRRILSFNEDNMTDCRASLKRIALIGFAIAAIASSSYAAPIIIYNTGVSDAGVPLAHGSDELHYTLEVVPGGTTDVQVLTSSGGFPIGPWLGDNLTSAWMGPDTFQADGPIGLYTYQTTFDLTGLNPATAALTGQWSADNTGVSILLNGLPTLNIPAPGFGGWTPFSIGPGLASFAAGTNTLQFLVENAGGPTGLRVEFFSATADPVGPSAVPEPTSMLLFGTGVVALARRRFAKSR
jgi:hypothetical protein